MNKLIGFEKLLAPNHITVNYLHFAQTDMVTEIQWKIPNKAL